MSFRRAQESQHDPKEAQGGPKHFYPAGRPRTKQKRYQKSWALPRDTHTISETSKSAEPGRYAPGQGLGSI